MWKRAAHTAVRARHSAACVCPSCPLSSLRRAAASSLSCISAARASASFVPRAAFHAASAPRFAAAAGGAKPPSDFGDLDDLFGEEQAVAPSGSSSSSRLSSTLDATRASTAASAAKHAAASSIESTARTLDDALALLNPKTPPRLEPKHLRLLRVAVSDLSKKLDRARSTERAANPSTPTPTNAIIEHLEQRLSVCQRLVAALFPAEVAGVPFDENATADILDYAEAMPGVLNVMTPDHVDPMKLMAIDHKTTRANRHLYCLFCKPSTAILEKNQLVYTNVNLLTQFVNERGMVMQRAESRLCMIHQRKLARTIKQARNIGLMSPSSNWRVDPEFVYGASAKEFNPHQTVAQASVSAGAKSIGLAQERAAPTSTMSATMFDQKADENDLFQEQDFTGKRRR